MCGETHLLSALKASKAGVGLGGLGQAGSHPLHHEQDHPLFTYHPLGPLQEGTGAQTPLGESSHPPGTLQAWSAQPGQMH